MKLSIWTGRVTPYVAVGKNQVKLLEFAYKYPKWHNWARDRATNRAVMGLVRRGALEINEACRMFKLKEV